MPELPELEAFVIAQREALTAEPVAAVPVAHFATLKTIDPPIQSLAGQRFTSLGRRAKRILLQAEGGDTIRRVSFEEHTIFYCPTCQTGGRTLADRRLSRLLRE